MVTLRKLTIKCGCVPYLLFYRPDFKALGGFSAQCRSVSLQLVKASVRFINKFIHTHKVSPFQTLL